MKNTFFLFPLVLALILTACAGATDSLNDLEKIPEDQPLIAVEETIRDWQPTFQELKLQESWGYDLRSMDVSAVDLLGIDYNYISYDTRTVWPDELPEGFDPANILDIGKNPGLGIRDLHAQGIDGSGVRVAVIDQALFAGHQEYADRLIFYERLHCSDQRAQMHGSAVASIAVGENVGVAPGAKLYYIASTFGSYMSGSFTFDAGVIADCVERVLEINERLPDDDKIRVISISRGYGPEDKGHDRLQAAITKADEQNVFVITTSTEVYYSDLHLFGMDRDYLSDPDDFGIYLPASWTAEYFYENPSSYENSLLVPMGSRAYASAYGETDYEIGRDGGLSWAVPWLAGFYALCCQVKPDITPQEFIQIAYDTSVMSETVKDDQSYPFGRIIDPKAVIDTLRTEQ